MSATGLDAAIATMQADGTPDEAVAAFAGHYRALDSGDNGLIRETDIEPVRDLPALEDIAKDERSGRDAFAATAVIKLNGGLATSMGMDRVKSLLTVKGERTFLAIIVEQVLAQRAQHGVQLPLLFMNSFRGRADTLAALEAYPDLAVAGLPIDFVQNREPKLLSSDLTPVQWPDEPDLQWCPPGHGDLYPALRASGALDALIRGGFRYAFCSNSDNLGATADPRIPGWMAQHGIPFVLESTQRTAADRKGGHLAVRRSDGRFVLRETAQTAPEDQVALQDLDRHPFCNTNNLWLDLHALRDRLDAGGLALPMICNRKTVDPTDPASPAVIQLESAMGSAVQEFEGARSILVGRDRFIPVKTTNDLLVLRSDLYEVDAESRLVPAAGRVSAQDTFVDLDPAFYKGIRDFDRRFPEGPPSLAGCTSFTVRGDVTFGSGVVARGEVRIDAT